MVGVVIYDRVDRISKRRMSTPDMVLLPAMSTDLETVLDALDLIAKRWQGMDIGDAGVVPNPRFEYWVTSGEVTRAELMKLSVHERNSLTANVHVGFRQLQISCANGTIYVGPETDSESRDAEREAIRIMLQGSSWRPGWRQLRKWLPLLPAVLVVVGVIWGIAASGFHPAVVLAGLGVGCLSVAFAWQWSVSMRRVLHSTSGPITFRAQSRQDLYASRADRLANLKVALVTAPVSIAVALFIAWATGFISSKP